MKALRTGKAYYCRTRVERSEGLFRVSKCYQIYCKDETLGEGEGGTYNHIYQAVS